MEDISTINSPTAKLFKIRTIPRNVNPTPKIKNNSTEAALVVPWPVEDEYSRWALNENEEPLIIEEHSDEEDLPFLSEQALRDLTGQEDLSKVLELELSSVDASINPEIDTLGRHLPALERLRMHRCSLSSFRDFGTSLTSLKCLWVPNCGISALDGIWALSNLEELYMSFNDVSDCTPLATHDRLQVLDLESNCLAEVSELEQLGTLPRLEQLTLAANPIAKVPQYRRVTCQYCTSLLSLDDEDISPQDQEPLEEIEMEQLVREALQSPNARPKTSAQRPTTSHCSSRNMGFKGEHPQDKGGGQHDEECEIEAVDEIAMITETIKHFRLLAGWPANTSRPSADGGCAGSASSIRSFPKSSPTPRRRPCTAPALGTSSSTTHNLSDVTFLRLLKMPDLEEGQGQKGFGSSLTHGTDVLFSGNIAKGMRRFKKSDEHPSLNFKSMDPGDSKNDKVRPATAPTTPAPFELQPSQFPEETRVSVNQGEPRKLPRAKSAEISHIEDDSETCLLPETSIEERESPGSLYEPLINRKGRFSPGAVDWEWHEKEAGLPDRRIRKTKVLGQKMSKSVGILPPMSSTVPESYSSPLDKGLSKSGVASTADLLNPTSIQRGLDGLHRKKGLGKANFMTDSELIDILQRKPQNVPELKTKNGFKRYFEGVDRARLTHILQQAYQDIDTSQRNEKISKRLEIFMET